MPPPISLVPWVLTDAQPQYIIMAIQARPLPQDPYNPSGSDNPLRHPSPFIPIRIPIFTPVVWLNELIVRLISFVGSAAGGRPASTGVGGLREPAGWGERRVRRMPSDSVESVEEGEAEGTSVPMETFSPQNSARRIRVSRGGRGGSVGGVNRKYD